jgi:hypothetical protein
MNMIDIYGNEWADVRSMIRSGYLIRDEDLEAMPEISRHDEPQISPQEYECGCVAVTRITDREAWREGRHERPFEMRLALPCATPATCELAAVRR